MVIAQPTGTVTLLFTDIEGSTNLLERLGADAYAGVLRLHRRLLLEAFERHAGYPVDEEGDALFVAFGRAEDAVAAAADGQLALAGAAWPQGVTVRVRVGIHSGEPLAVPPNYVGMDVHRAARIMAAGHGGQVLVSGTTRALLDGVDLIDLGPQRLKDMLEPIRLYQLVIDGQPREFPPLKSLHRSNLPIAAWPLLGRDQELAALRGFVSDGARLITLTGPGGTGKTRLALQAAAELADSFAGGTFFVPLAALRESAAVRPVVAEALGLRPDDDLNSLLRSAPVLLVLDNLEQLSDVASVVAGLIVGATVVLATSRAPLHVSAERELAVPPLGEASAVELFLSRAAAVGRRVEADGTVAAICRRLDNLPLAIELAAARTRLLTPAALLERLSSALPLLSGGAHDLPERQRTLRATIAWSYDLLDEPERAGLRRLSVFRGSFALEDAEAVAEVSLDEIESLVEHSLIVAQPSGRCILLETMREFARERLEDAGETREYDLRHAHHFLDLLIGREPLLRTERGSEVILWFRLEEEHLATMLDRLSVYEPVQAARAAFLLGPYWIRIGAAVDARLRLQAILRLDLPDESRAMVLNRLAGAEERLDNVDAAYAAATESVALAEAAGARALIVDSLGWVALEAGRRGDTDEAVRLARRAAEVATDIDAESRLLALHDLGDALGMAGQTEEALATLRRAADESKQVGHALGEMYSWFNIGYLELQEGNHEAAQSAFVRTTELNRRLEDRNIATRGLLGLGYAALGLERPRDARASFAEMLELALGSPNPLDADVAFAAYGIALSADPAQRAEADRLRRSIALLRDAGSLAAGALFETVEQTFAARAQGSRSAADTTDDDAMTLDEIVEMARVLAGGG